MENLRNKAMLSMESLFPSRHIVGADGNPVPFHRAQNLIYDSTSRTLVMSAGTQGGKTSFGGWWLNREIESRGSGDYLAVTSTFDLFKLKMLPALIEIFVDILKRGRYWTLDKVIELRNPSTGEFMAKKSQDKMWARIILRSADALGGLESATAKAAWLDECGQDKFTVSAFRAIKRRVALNRGRLLLTSTLYNYGWLVDTIIDPAILTGKTIAYYDNGGEIDYTVSEEMDTTVVQFDSVVNPIFPVSEYNEARENLSEEEFNMFYRGRKTTRRFLIFDCFDRSRHTCQPFEIPEHWNRYVGIDFGGQNTAAVFYAEDPQTKTLYAFAEYLTGNIPIQTHVKNLYSISKYITSAVGGARNEGQWRMEFSKHGLYVEEPLIHDVNLGIARVYAQHKNDGIIYFSNLNGIIDEKGRYRRKRDGSGNILDDIEDRDMFHLLDAERYIISKIRPGVSMRAKVISIGGGNNAN